MRRDLPLVILSMTVWGIGEGMFFFFQPLYLQELGANPITIGMILGSVGVVMALVHIPAGYLADRFGRRQLLWSAWILGTLATLIMAFAPSLQWFVAGMVIYGITIFVAVPLNSYVTAARGSLTIGRVLTFSSAAFNLGAILGPIIGGLIGQVAGLQTTFKIAALFFVVSTGLILFIRKQPIEPDRFAQPLQGLKSLLNRQYIQYLVLIFVAVLFMYLPQPLSQNYLQNEQGIQISEIGFMLAVRSLGIVLLNLFLGRLLARQGFLIAQFCMVIFSLLMWANGGMLSFYLAYFLLGSYQTARTLANAQGRYLVEARSMGLAYGLIETMISSAVIIAPLAAGFIYNFNPVLIYPISLGLILLSLVLNKYLLPRNNVAI